MMDMMDVNGMMGMMGMIGVMGMMGMMVMMAMVGMMGMMSIMGHHFRTNLIRIIELLLFYTQKVVKYTLIVSQRPLKTYPSIWKLCQELVKILLFPMMKF